MSGNNPLGYLLSDHFMPVPPAGQPTPTPSSGMPLIMMAASPVTGWLQPYVNGRRQLTIVPYSPSPVFDGDIACDYLMTLTGNVAPTFINMLGSADYSILFLQDGTGNHTITWPSTWSWVGGAYTVQPAVLQPFPTLAAGTGPNQITTVQLNLVGETILARVTL